MKVAIVYDRVNKWGGAERVLLALHELFPKAPLYTSLYVPETSSWAGVFPGVIPSFLDKVKIMCTRHEHIPYLMPVAFESFDFSEYDIVISVTSEAAKGIITGPNTLHVCYCLTPTRYLWSGYDEYFKNALFRLLTRPVVSYLRKWDKIASSRPDVIIAISKTVAERIKEFYQRRSDVVYPPVDLEKFNVTSGDNRQSFYLLVSRFTPYKKVDIAIKAFNELGLPLLVVGKGSEGKRLVKMAKGNITFLGNLTDEKLLHYYRKCKALVFPQEEDFGLTAVEAQACGAPVIAYKKGGATETVIDGETGIFFKEQSVDSLKEAITKFEQMKFDQREISKNMRRFSKKYFQDSFLNAVKRAYTARNF